MSLFNFMRRHFEDARRRSGETFEIERDRLVRTVVGLHYKTQHALVFFPEDDVRVGDVVTSTATKDAYAIADTTKLIADGKVLTVTMYYASTSPRHTQRAAATLKD